MSLRITYFLLIFISTIFEKKPKYYKGKLITILALVVGYIM